ncbi:MAG TPA: type II toxin-antitoxin system death-on-curing family toxin [Aggregatilineales bacterium]|nr:type II toxin-antitoxin system death-on-curing family toxin [Aggregatilineales bacterium]
MRYLTTSELIYINGIVLNNPKILSGRQQIRDFALLDAAVARPAASAFGEDAYPTLNEKVAVMVHSVTRNHPFTDGNKRTAVVAAVFMLGVNGQRVVWERDDALKMILDVAQGRADAEALARWFPLVPGESAPAPDADQDMRAIARIVEEQKGLLDELARR